MGVKTRADEKLIEIREHVQEAIEGLSSIVIGRCSGWNEFSPEAMREHEQALQALLEVRQKLDP